MTPIYEVVSGQILLARRNDFFRLHSEVLLPIMQRLGIRPVLMLVCELGAYGRFLDIYQYESLADYERISDQLLAQPELPEYYTQVGLCVHGSITVEIMQELPYAKQWIGRG